MSSHVKIDLLQFYQNCASSPNLPQNYVTAIYSKLIECLQALHQPVLNELSELFSFHRLRRNALLQKPHAKITRLWLIESGVAHTFLSKPEKQCTCCFHFPGELVGHYVFSQLNQRSNLSIKTLSKMKCWSIEVTDLNELCQRHPHIHPIIQWLQVGKIAWLYQTEYCLGRLSTFEHYQLLLDQFPDYFQNIPQKYIASYLKINAGSLSRMRSNHLRNK